MRIPRIIQSFMTAQLLLILVLSSPAAALAQEDGGDESAAQSDISDLGSLNDNNINDERSGDDDDDHAIAVGPAGDLKPEPTPAADADQASDAYFVQCDRATMTQ